MNVCTILWSTQFYSFHFSSIFHHLKPISYQSCMSLKTGLAATFYSLPSWDSKRPSPSQMCCHLGPTHPDKWVLHVTSVDNSNLIPGFFICTNSALARQREQDALLALSQQKHTTPCAASSLQAQWIPALWILSYYHSSQRERHTHTENSSGLCLNLFSVAMHTKANSLQSSLPWKKGYK